MGMSAISSSTLIIIFCVFVLLFADLIVTNINLSELINSSDGKNASDSAKINKLQKLYKSKFKYTMAIITLVLIYYIINAIIFAFAQSLK